MAVTPFKRRGFYLHASWQYRYPFAVRAWSPDDYAGMFELLHRLKLNCVMIWPMTELVPPHLSADDRTYLMKFRDIVGDAARFGLESWLVVCPCVSTTDAVRPAAMKDRVFYPNMQTFRFDEPERFNAYMKHLADILSCLNNADGYVFIDGDPGGYPEAKPADFVRMLHGVRRILSQCSPGRRPKVIPWIWSGWGADWEKEGVWKPDLRRLVAPFIKAIQDDPPGEPWEALPGRSIRDGHANGRINCVLAEKAGLLDRSTFMTYEIVEFEPTPPAFVLQFGDIRRVILEELDKAHLVKGIMGNAQQPVSALHNLFYFARCAENPEWLDKPDDAILWEFATFLGGDAEILVPAWKVAHTALDNIPPQLAARVRESELRAEAARAIPGGPALYLELLSEFVQARVEVLEQTACTPHNASDTVTRLATAIAAILRWWSRHRYVCTGAKGPGFQWEYTHPTLLDPLTTWIKQLNRRINTEDQRSLAAEVAAHSIVDTETADRVVRELLQLER